EGRIYVVNHGRSIGTAPTPSPGPPPTREPSLAPGQSATPEPAATDGVLVFAPRSFGFERAHPIPGVGDVASGPAGTFVSRELEILPLDRPDRPLYALPFPDRPRAPAEGPRLSLEAPSGGGLAASLSHCYFQGLLRFDAPLTDPMPAAFGGIDRPLLAGPALPRRIAAGQGLNVLQGRFSTSRGPEGDIRYHPAESALESEPQSLQRWDVAGRLMDQLGVCAGDPEAPAATWARDVAADGERLYTLDPGFVRQRVGPHFPTWSHWSGSTGELGAPHYLEALDAVAGRVEYLDLGAGELIRLDAAGALVGRTPLRNFDGVGEGGFLPVDIALEAAGTRFLADAGAGRLRIDGPRESSWLALHDRPRRIASGADGQVFVLGRGGMVHRYDPQPDGRYALGAAWSLPDPESEALDIAADAGGRVYVSFARVEPLRSPAGGSTASLTRAGVWVFEPRPAPSSDLPPAGACVLAPDKRASPEVLDLGQSTEIQLRLTGACPGEAQAISLALVVDHSGSMAWNGALERAREAGIALLQRLDPGRDRLSLVGYAGDAELLSLADGDLAGAAAYLAALEPAGASQVSDAIDLARLAIADAPGRRAILVISDGGHRDDPTAAVAAARAAGIEVSAWVFRSDDFRGLTWAAALTGGDRDRVLLDPDAVRQADWLDQAQAWSIPDTLLESATLVDQLPDNMRYVEGSARPNAVYDAASRSLTWRLGPLAAADALSLSFQVEPLEAGLWPTNAEAELRYRDGLGARGSLRFPLPEVRVRPAPPRAGTAFLPFLARRICRDPVRPLDLVLVVDTSQSMGAAGLDPGTKLGAAQAAAGDFVDRLDLARDRVAVVGFNETATVALGLSADRARIGLALSGLTLGAGTRIDAGLRAARGILQTEGRTDAGSVVILLTDGRHGGPAADPLLESDRLRRLGSLIYCIGLGDDLDPALLEAIASPPGSFLVSPDTAQLGEAYRAILERLACDSGGGSAASARPGRGALRRIGP
ncbi:MAG: VWA domain-containing protein, partial [Chloroflexi bacterium]|nr:VWA domain-containing protein [Chloroflexota bacterium]